MKNNLLKISIFPAILFSLLMVSSLALASEVTGNLSTGINSTVGNTVNGTVIVAPTASPVAGTHTSAQSVTLTASGASSIHYTTNGTAPTCSTGTVYSSAISVNSSTVIKAISCYPDNHSSSVVSFGYVINLNITPSQISSLLDNGTFTIPSGSSNSSTPSITTTQQVVVDVSDNGGTSEITLPDNLVITSVNGGNIDATLLTGSAPSEGSLSGLGSGAVVDGALQWGIVNLGLQFNIPITLSIFVGTNHNGETLTVQRSVTGNSGWTTDGIVAPGTCVVSSGLCTFQATKASYYASFHIVSSGGGGGGGGGGNYTPAPVTPAPVGQVLGAVSPHGNGTLIADNGTIYLVTNGQKHGFRDATEYLSYGFDFSSVQPASSADLALPNGSILKAMDGTLALDTSDGRTVYVIGNNGTKRGFVSSAVFTKLGYKFSQAVKINLADYAVGDPITTSNVAHPDGTLVISGKTIWWINAGTRHGFTSMDVFNSYGWTIQKVLKANSADMALPEASVLQLRGDALTSGSFLM